MNTESIVRNARLVARAEKVVADIHLRTLVTKSALVLLALLLALFGAGMLAFAVFVALEARYGPVLAALAVGAGAIVLAGGIVAVAGRMRPGRELDLARQLQDQAMEALMADLRGVEADVRGLTRLVRNPLDGALASLVLPLATMILKSLRKPAEGGKD